MSCCSCRCRQSCSEPSCTNYGNRCRIPLCCSPGLCDESYITKKDHLYFNSRKCQCSWAPRFDDKYGWNSKQAPVYCTRFDAPSPVKPPWCPPGAKTRSYLYPRFYKKNCDGWYPDECRCRPQCRVRNPCGTANCENTCGIRKWSIPLCKCPLCGRSRDFPSPCCCGCAPSPTTCPLRLRCCSCRTGCQTSCCPCCFNHCHGCHSARCCPPRCCCGCSGCCGRCCNNSCGPPRTCASCPQQCGGDRGGSSMGSRSCMKCNGFPGDFMYGVTPGNDFGGGGFNSC